MEDGKKSKAERQKMGQRKKMKESNEKNETML
jgi:hypothetical protein